YLDTWDFSFFDRTGQVERITQGPATGKYSFKPNAAQQLTIEPVAPSARRYQGQAYLLVGPENSSATFILADLAQKSQAAILVGQPTGGNQRGLNGGQLLWVNLPNSGVGVDIPLLASTYELTTPDQSVTPDVVVKRDFEQSRAGLDQEVHAVLRLIRQLK
ncbi:MAG: S41 family peptidase, partial [Burkholderiaceae bacterium]|nr:S41 family peptidase [Burkholderiaceae bacterium]